MTSEPKSNYEIVTPEPKPWLTTLVRVKAELGITNSADDTLLQSKIGEASSDITLALGFAVASETVKETFRHEAMGRAFGRGAHHAGEGLFLRRKAITAINSVTLDDGVLTAAEYYVNNDEGTLNRLDLSGYPCSWSFCKSLIVQYVAGYVLPAVTGTNLPPSIEGVTVDLLKMFWFSRTRDPLIKSQSIPGVRDVEYWVGAVGDPDLLPPSVQSKVALLRRPRMAVA